MEGGRLRDPPVRDGSPAAARPRLQGRPPGGPLRLGARQVHGRRQSALRQDLEGAAKQRVGEVNMAKATDDEGLAVATTAAVASILGNIAQAIGGAEHRKLAEGLAADRARLIQLLGRFRKSYDH